MRRSYYHVYEIPNGNNTNNNFANSIVCQFISTYLVFLSFYLIYYYF